MGKAAATAALFTCALLAACSGNPDRENAAGPASETGSVTVAPEKNRESESLRNLRVRTGADAAAFHRILSSWEGPGASPVPAERLPAGPGRALRGFPAPTGIASVPAGGQEPLSGSLFKTAARTGAKPLGLAKVSADPEGFAPDIWFEGDTAWFGYDDSAQGRLLWIHCFHDSEEDIHALVRDTLTYRWPYDPAAPVLLSSVTHVRRWDGNEYRMALSGRDGALSEGRVLVRREWTSVSNDTIHKTGTVTEASGGRLEDGRPIAFTDSVFIGGKAGSGSATYDADGDGFLLSASPGESALVRTETFLSGRDGFRVHRDSTVWILNDPAESGDDRVAFHASWSVFEDGAEARLTAGPLRGGSGFGPEDTVVVRETQSFLRCNPETRAPGDSLERISWVRPGNLADPADDRAERRSERIWFRDGGMDAAANLSGNDTGSFLIRGDDASWTVRDADTATTFTAPVRSAAGSRTVVQRTLDGAGRVLAEGSFRFLPDGTGDGTIREFTEGAEAVSLEIGFGADGAVFVDGTRADRSVASAP